MEIIFVQIFFRYFFGSMQIFILQRYFLQSKPHLIIITKQIFDRIKYIFHPNMICLLIGNMFLLSVETTFIILIKSPELLIIGQTLNLNKRTNLQIFINDFFLSLSFQVCAEQKCQEEVVLLALNYMDRFLSTKSVRKTHLQILAAACLLLASKLREPSCRALSAELLVFYTDNSIYKGDLIVSIKFYFSTPLTFLK